MHSEGAIEIRIRELAQMFNSLDPSPFRERDLDDDAEEFIAGWARELPAGIPLQIVIHLPQDAAIEAKEKGLSDAVQNYFSDRTDILERDLRELFRTGWRHLWVGLSVLTACLLASRFAGQIIASESIARIVEESFIIVGWVANWKPIEIFLYDWWPVRRRIALYRRLRDAVVILRTEPD